MNDTPTPRTDKAAYSMGRSGEQRDIERWCDLLNESRKLERELTAALEEIKELNDKLDDAVADATNAVNDIIRMKWQRDRLAEALKSIRAGYGGQIVDLDCNCDDCEFLRPIDEALQSLTQP